MPNEAKNVHTCSMQTDSRQAGGGRGQANFFGVNAFCTKTWFFGCQRSVAVDVAVAEQRCVGVAACRCCFFFFFLFSVFTIVAISAYALVTVTQFNSLTV